MALPTLRMIGFIIGLFLLTIAVSMLIPMLTVVLYDRTDDLSAFGWSALTTGIAGLVLTLPGRPKGANLRPRDMYMLTTASWIVVCVFAALPMVLIQHISYTDAFFETMSGITTTGSTVITGLDSASPGLLIWRSMLHWLGGIGFIGMAVAILPLLRVGGMRLFQTDMYSFCCNWWSALRISTSPLKLSTLMPSSAAATLTGSVDLALAMKRHPSRGLHAFSHVDLT